MTDSLAPAITLGTVIDVESPDGLGQVRVQRFDMPPGVETSWLPVMTPFASDGAGLLIPPEIGDIAVLAFNGRRPIVLGFLYTGPMQRPTDLPEEKVLVSKDGNALKLVDGGDKGITLADANGNEIVMNAEGITLKSNGNIKVEAAGTTTVIGTMVELNP